MERWAAESQAGFKQPVQLKKKTGGMCPRLTEALGRDRVEQTPMKSSICSKSLPWALASGWSGTNQKPNLHQELKMVEKLTGPFETV